MYPSTPALGRALLGASTFVASVHPSESCGSNGLPLTPNSIRIYGRARALYLVNHPHLCTYVDVHRGKHERILVVQEYYPLTLKAACQTYDSLRCEASIAKIAHQVLQGLVYINNFGTVCRNLTPETILIDPTAQTKLYNYGLYYMTEGGSAVSFPIGVPQYLPPEVIIGSPNNTDGSPGGSVSGNPSWDVWSLAIILLECITGQTYFMGGDSVISVIEGILAAAKSNNVISYLGEMYGGKQQINGISEILRDFLNQCLLVDPKQRPLPITLLNHPIFQTFNISSSLMPISPQFPVIDPTICLVDFSEYRIKLDVTPEYYKDVLLNYPHLSNKQTKQTGNKPWRFSDVDHLSTMSVREVYHLWQLAGGHVEQELKKNKLIHTRPSILTLPSLMVVEGEVFGGGFQRDQLLQTTTHVLSLETLHKTLSHIPCYKYYPLITQGENGTDTLEMSKLPLVIRERDVEYQLHRLLVFERLLKAYPYKVDAIIREARKDIPPFYRALIWAALLRVDGNIAEAYDQVDKETPTTTDRQIEVDIPRCHQYDELLSSPRGHVKFSRVLKAWVVANSRLVYWQGLDSLCAPFLALNFNNEALAFACLKVFINKYLHKFFLRDNSAVIQEYLAKFSHMISYHEPQLFNHLDSIGFVPDLYAIPWFLTMYTHVFPLHKIFLLWDTLLLGESSLPLCVGIALLKQLKDRLLQFGFNECILLFSDMPDIKMEQVVIEAKEVFCSTPASVTYREHDTPSLSSKHDSPMHQSSINDKELLMEPISLQELKGENCPRISGADVIELLAQRRSRSGKGKLLVVDVRPQEQYLRGSLAAAINLPAESCFNSDGKLVACHQADILCSYRGKIIAVMGSRTGHKLAVKVAEQLVSLDFPRVCTLHRGVEAFRGSGHLVVPS